MKAQTADSNVVDLCAAKAAKALARIADAEASAGDAVNRTREDWMEYGEQLLDAKNTIAGKKEFGQWIKANGLDLGVAKHREVRRNAMWLAAHRAELHMCNSELRNHHPTHIRQECRKDGYDWAQTTPKVATRATAKRSQILAKVASDHDEVMREVAKLPKSTQAVFTSLFEKEVKALRAQFSQELKAEVDKRLASEKALYEQATERMKSLHEELGIREKKLDEWMTQEEFKIILGCLHPDRQSEEARERYNKAFQIFKRLEAKVEADGRVRRARGW